VTAPDQQTRESDTPDRESDAPATEFDAPATEFDPQATEFDARDENSDAPDPEADPLDSPEETELPGEVAMAADSELPDVTADADLEAALEALLLVVDSPAEEELLATAVGVPLERITETLHRMAAAYAEAQRGIDLRHVGGGWRFYTRDRFAPFVEKLLLDGQRSRLTRAALETLAVIAYRQPVTRQRVAAVRGVNVDGVIRTLLARGLIEETGTDRDTGGILYRTTELFLERIGLSSLDELPPIAPLLPEVDSIDDV
jgi:segregation and condensation protein B